MKQVYLAASWSRQSEARKLAEELEDADVHVKASWLYERECPHPALREKHAREAGYQDIRDIYECDVFVRLADDLSQPLIPSHLATGARMFEQGLAYGLGKQIYVVGGRQMLFDYMPHVCHVRDKAQLIRELCPQIL